MAKPIYTPLYNDFVKWLRANFPLLAVPLNDEALLLDNPHFKAFERSRGGTRMETVIPYEKQPPWSMAGMTYPEWSAAVPSSTEEASTWATAYPDIAQRVGLMPTSTQEPSGVMGKTEIIQMGDYDVLVTTMPSGEKMYDVIGRTQKPEDGTPDWANRMAELATQKQWEEAANQRAQAQRWLTERTPTPWWQSQPDNSAELSQQFESMRQQLMGQLQGTPGEWINYQKVKGLPNPYQTKQTGMTATEDIGRLNEDIKAWKSYAKDIEDRLDDRYDPLYMNDELSQRLVAAKKTVSMLRAKKTVAEGESLSLPEISDLRSQGFSESDISQLGSMTGGYLEPGMSWTSASPTVARGAGLSSWGIESYLAQQREEARKPATPSWLPEYVPGLGGRIPLENAPKGTIPSAQAWSRLSPTRQQMLGGYWRHAGQQPQDILQSMQSMLPQEPRFGRTWKAF